MKRFLYLFAALSVSAKPIEVLQWDPSTTVGVVYRLYTSTNSPATSGSFRDLGTNITAIVSVVGIQFHQVTAVSSGTESEPSNEITLTNAVVNRPTNLRRITN